MGDALIGSTWSSAVCGICDVARERLFAFVICEQLCGIEQRGSLQGASVSPSKHVWPTPLLGSRGIRILGIPLGLSEHVVAQLQETIESHRTFLELIALTNLQSAWLLLL